MKGSGEQNKKLKQKNSKNKKQFKENQFVFESLYNKKSLGTQIPNKQTKTKHKNTTKLKQTKHHTHTNKKKNKNKNKQKQNTKQMGNNNKHTTKNRTNKQQVYCLQNRPTHKHT